MRLANFHRREGGQTFVMLALMLTVLLGFSGIVIDVAWYEVNLIRVQKAADAAALAGVVYLPGNVSGAQTAARSEATKNGYTTGVNGATVSATIDPLNNKGMLTTVTAPVNTFFARMFGVPTFTAFRRARAEFILPVPMGSPLDYFGVHVLCRNTDTPPACPAVASATGAGTLSTLGFWGAVEAKGTQRGNGDAYSTFYNGGTSPNTAFDANGYSYVVELAAGTVNGTVYIYDPVFCATGAGTSTGRRLGVGDFWLGSGGTPITTEFKLWDMQGTPYSVSDDTLVATDGGLFASMGGVDKSISYKGDMQWGGGASGTSSTYPDCAATPFHNAWYPLATGLSAGEYRLQVVTSAGGLSQDAVNNWAIQVTRTAGPQGKIYGQSRMCVYVNIAGTSIFYLAQVDAVHAGKTLEIKLFDPGDIRSTSIRVKIPNSAGYTDASFTYTATGATSPGTTSGGPTTSLTTANASTSFYNNQWLTILVNIPTTYGSTGPGSITPPTETEPGWWKIQYATTGTGQDVTTWEVNIRGNPVHLVIP
jgi:hypothetical protein